MREISAILRFIPPALIILLGPHAAKSAQIKASPGNLFFSPYSISTCLAMTYAGARGETESQMAQVLHFTKNQAEVHSSFGELQRRLHEANKQKGIELTIANALWSQEGHAFVPGFLDIAKGAYQANVNQ